jgi:hypothetical protein
MISPTVSLSPRAHTSHGHAGAIQPQRLPHHVFLSYAGGNARLRIDSRGCAPRTSAKRRDSQACAVAFRRLGAPPRSQSHQEPDRLAALSAARTPPAEWLYGALRLRLTRARRSWWGRGVRSGPRRARASRGRDGTPRPSSCTEGIGVLTQNPTPALRSRGHDVVDVVRSPERGLGRWDSHEKRLRRLGVWVGSSIRRCRVLRWDTPAGIGFLLSHIFRDMWDTERTTS